MGFSLGKTIDKVASGLRAIGLDARVVEGSHRGSTLGWLLRDDDQSLGLIEIHHSPIRWVNVIKEKRYVGQGPYGGSKEVEYRNVYVVSDPHVSAKGGYRLIESAQVKSIPVVGRVVDIRWKSKSQDELVRRLSEDVLLTQALAKLKENVTIRSFLEYQCWSISSSRTSTGNIPWILFTHPAPSRAQWNCYETIARNLLEYSGK